MNEFFTIRNQFYTRNLKDFQQFYELNKKLFTQQIICCLLKECFSNKPSLLLDYMHIFIKQNPCILDYKLLEDNTTIRESIISQSPLNQIQELISFGIHIQKSNPYTLLKLAICNPLHQNNNPNMPKINTNIVMLLFEKYPKEMERALENKNMDQRPLGALAIQMDSIKLATFLLNKDPRILPKNTLCDNQLHILFKSKSMKQFNLSELKILINLLLNLGVDPEQQNSKGLKPINLCPEFLKKEFQSIVQSYRLCMNKEPKIQKTKYKNRKYEREDSHGMSQPYAKKVVVKIDSQEDQALVNQSALHIYNSIAQNREQQSKMETMRFEEAKKKQLNRLIMNDTELKIYLEEDIKYEVERLKAMNKRFQASYQQLIGKLNERIIGQLPVKLTIFGSHATQLSLSQSDIDMVITAQQEMNPLTILQQIHYILTTMKEQIDNSKLIKSATVPIIKAECTKKYTMKKIDITIQDNNHNGIESVKLIKNYLNIYHQLQSLVFVLKKFIYRSKLFAPFKGGLSSYALILMIVAILEVESQKLKDSGQKFPHAELLIRFLRVYGNQTNYQTKIIKLAGSPDRVTDTHAGLKIYDPLDPNNNVGRSTYKIQKIKRAFQVALLSLFVFKKCRRENCKSRKQINKIPSCQIDVRYRDNQRPCCLLKRMFKSAPAELIEEQIQSS